MSNRIHTLNHDEDDRRPNLQASSGEESEGEGSDPRRRRPQEYYVGGSERSGQQVIDPRRPGEPNEPPHPMAPLAFNARLGGGHAAPGSVLRVVVELFDDGFTVDNSALRPYDTPEAIAFMDDLKARRTPEEFKRKYGANKAIDVHCFKKPGNYVFQPFSGAGQRLGAPTPATADEVPANSGLPEETLITDTSSLVTEQMRARAQQSIGLIDASSSAPTTRLQFRFPNGHRITGIFSPDHTIHHHMRTFVVSADPAFSYRLFNFYTGFPPAKIEDEQQTIKEAGIGNSVILVRL
uniref:UBX domain-containing protein n=1 Tax=Panagrellus redivivus TaxID=6233 RepID=A0A7E4VDF8_PANRE